MALIGREGNLEFQRTLPVPRVLPSSRLDRTNNYFVLDSDEFWIGDFVRVVGWNGTVTEVKSGFLHRDELNRITLYTTLEASLSKRTANRVSFSTWTQNFIIVAPDPTSAQTTILTNHYQSIRGDATFSLTTETPLSRWPDKIEEYREYGPLYSSWKLQGQVRGWQLSLASTAIDTTGLGTVFSENIKASVSGSGTVDFIIDLYGQSDEYDSSAMLRLVTLISEAAECNAELYLKRQSQPYKNVLHARDMSFLQGSLFYRSKILLTSTGIDVTADGIITGSADFVTTGKVDLVSRDERLPEPEYTLPEVTGALFDAWMYPSTDGRNNAVSEPDGSVYLIQFSYGDYSHTIVKHTNTDYPLWSKRYVNFSDGYFYQTPGTGNSRLAFDGKSRLCLAMIKYNNSAERDSKVELIRINKSNGNTEFRASFEFVTNFVTNNDGHIDRLDFDSNGNIYLLISGVWISSVRRSVIIKLDSSGSLVWIKNFEKSGSSIAMPSYKTMVVRGSSIYLTEVSPRSTYSSFGPDTRTATICSLNLDGEVTGLQTTIRASIDYDSSTMVYSPGLSSFAFDSLGNIYAAQYLHNQYGLLGVCKLTPTLQPVWNRHYSLLGASIESASAAGIDRANVFIDNQDRIFIAVNYRQTPHTGVLMEINQNGDPLGSRGFQGVGYSSSTSTTGWRAYDIAYPSQNSQENIILIGYNNQSVVRAKKEGQLGTWYATNNTTSSPAYITITAHLPIYVDQPITVEGVSQNETYTVDYSAPFAQSSNLPSAEDFPPYSLSNRGSIKIGN